MTTLAVFSGVLAALLQTAAPRPVRYEVTPDVKSEKWSVVMTIDAAKAAPFDLWVPRWTPGGYHLVEFGQFVDSVKGTDSGGAALTVAEHDEPVHWTITPAKAGPVKIVYTASLASKSPFDATALDVEANRITSGHAFLNSTSLFAFVPGELDRPVEVKMNAPEGWKVATVLVKDKDGLYTAPSYYRLEDSPFLMSSDLQVAS
jgi:predicted metalloprotease with PDZ domain